MGLIDADALMKTLGITDMDCGKCDLHGTIGCSKNGGFVDACVAIEHAPIIEERKTGKWEEKTICDDAVITEWQSARCPVCKKYHTTPYMYFFHDYNYCPECGADLRGGGKR